MSSSQNVASLLAPAAVPSFKCPAGTKMHILDLGTLEADESWYARLQLNLINLLTWC